jgi:Ni,Fe-hydrogenase III large subunit
VGPVHAGVIEPGHFRFNCIGERVLHLEIQLGYQHRAWSNCCSLRRPNAAHSGRIHCRRHGHRPQPVHGPGHGGPHRHPAGCKGAKVIRTIALELERIANHVGDLGALSGDVAFLPPANYCGRMRGDFLNMSLWICGNRFGKGLVRPGGVCFP